MHLDIYSDISSVSFAVLGPVSGVAWGLFFGGGE